MIDHKQPFEDDVWNSLVDLSLSRLFADKEIAMIDENKDNIAILFENTIDAFAGHSISYGGELDWNFIKSFFQCVLNTECQVPFIHTNNS
jgi:hypothetical protein